MSQPELERFVRDLAADKDLLAEVRGAAGMRGAADIARRRGYAVSHDEVAAFVARSVAGANPLSDAQLSGISGGQAEPIEVIDAQRRVLDAIKAHEP
ncbi:MAG: Nif11 family protein [Reyranella sp.]|nr:MAG: Nif11 family protein [Reyranella sp.]